MTNKYLKKIASLVKNVKTFGKALSGAKGKQADRIVDKITAQSGKRSAAFVREVGDSGTYAGPSERHRRRQWQLSDREANVKLKGATAKAHTTRARKQVGLYGGVAVGTAGAIGTKIVKDKKNSK